MCAVDITGARRCVQWISQEQEEMCAVDNKGARRDVCSGQHRSEEMCAKEHWLRGERGFPLAYRVRGAADHHGKKACDSGSMRWLITLYTPSGSREREIQVLSLLSLSHFYIPRGVSPKWSQTQISWHSKINPHNAMWKQHTWEVPGRHLLNNFLSLQSGHNGIFYGYLFIYLGPTCESLKNYIYHRSQSALNSFCFHLI